MTNLLINNIGQSIPLFVDSLKNRLPIIENEVNSLIKRKSKNRRAIEKRLEVLLLLNMYGIADGLFNQLLEYYKTIKQEKQGHDTTPYGVIILAVHQLVYYATSLLC